MRICYYNGKIYLDDKTIVEAIFIEDGFLIDSGDMEDVLIKNQNYKPIDLLGKSIKLEDVLK